VTHGLKPGVAAAQSRVQGHQGAAQTLDFFGGVIHLPSRMEKNCFYVDFEGLVFLYFLVF